MSEERVTLRFDSFRSFLDQCSDRISEQGIFLATEAIQPVGSTVEFDLGIDSEFPLLRGSGEVIWVVEPGGDDVAGMAVRYERTDEATATLARKIAERQRTRTGSAFELARADAGEPVAAAEAAAGSEAPERSPSFATQKVDDLIVAAEEPEVEAAVEAEPAVEAEAEAEPAPIEMPAAVVEEPTIEPRPSRKRGRGGLWATLALIAALTGAAYWQRGFLLEKLGGGRQPGLETRASEPESTEIAEPEVQAPAEPEAQAPAEPDIQTAPPPSGPLSAIEEIRWRATEGATLLQLVADGSFPSGGYGVERLEDPPRLLLKIAGVTQPLASPTLAVGTDEVVGVRTALHGSPPSTALHVVVDLADPTAQVTATEATGAVLQLRVSSAAISP